MADYASVRSNWWASLNWHVKENGTRPDGIPGKPGKAWEDAEFALACNVGDADKPDYAARTVQNWFDEALGVVPRNREPIEKALMGSEPAYAEWRRDLRVAYGTARKRKGSQKTRESAAEQILTDEPPEAPDEPRNREAFAYLVGDGQLRKDGDKIVITPRFLHQLWLQSCDPAFVSAITDPEQELKPDETMTLKVMVHLLLPDIRISNQTFDQLVSVVDEAALHIYRILVTKADFLGLCEYEGGRIVNHEQCVDVLTRLLSRLPENPSEAVFFRQFFEAWKDAIADSINRIRDEDPRFIEILAPIMYAISYDSGGLADSRNLWEDWQASKEGRSIDDFDVTSRGWQVSDLEPVSRSLRRLIAP